MSGRHEETPNNMDSTIKKGARTTVSAARQLPKLGVQKGERRVFIWPPTMLDSNSELLQIHLVILPKDGRCLSVEQFRIACLA